MVRPSFRVPVALCAGWLVSSLSGCVREHALFDPGTAGEVGIATSAGSAGVGQGGTSAGSPGVPAAGTSGAGASGKGGGASGEATRGGAGGASGEGGKAGANALWTESSCVMALGQGKMGDACSGTFKCTATTDCCATVAFCDGTTLNIENNCTLCPMKCSADSDCGAKALCESYQCKSCPSEPCPDTWSAVLRNGCAVCVPPNECNSAADPVCGQLTCTAGQSCLPGCKGDPSCCFGNQCLPKECPSLSDWDCLIVGCPPGAMCKVAGQASTCKCYVETGAFVCVGGAGNTCVAR